MKTSSSLFKKNVYAVSTALLLAVGMSAAQSAKAQSNPNITVEDDGSVFIDRNGFDIYTGPLQNNSNIPLPEEIIMNPEEEEAVPVVEDQLSPNTLNLQVDTESINRQFQQVIDDRPIPSSFEIQNDSLQFQSRFEVNYSPGNHDFGEGIEVNVYGPDGTLRSSEKVFIRGDRVERFNGQSLPTSDSIQVTYGPEERVELRVLTLRPEDGEITENESAIYPTVRGEFAVEDFPDGQNIDFNDGDYLEMVDGVGEAEILSERSQVVQGPVENVEVIRTPFVDVRVVDTVEREMVMSTEQFTEVDEERDYGEVEDPRTDPILLPHAIGIRTEDGEQLIYDQYSDTAQVRLGTEGGTITGQTAPLVEDPAAAPTLITGTANFDPFADENEAGLSVNVGVTQYLHSTHEQATGMLGNPIANPDPDGPRLVQPTGLFDNTRIVGYVEATPEEVMPGEPLSSVEGVFNLPEDRAVVITPADPSLVGPGEAAYTENVGGLIIERNDGTAEFVPQWTENGFESDPIRLEAGEAERVIYALVPQQPGQSLELGESYDLNAAGTLITEGGYEVISATQRPDNFVREMAEVYAVEDTLPGQNAVTEEFNGLRGLYQERPGGEVIPTVDETIPTMVDARVGNQLLTEDIVIPGEPGQLGYRSTTVAGGLYARGSLGLGIGNQEDVVTTTTSTFEADVATITNQFVTETYRTPGTEVETITTTQITETSQDIRQTGTANFDVAANGLLADLNVDVGNEEVIDQQSRVVEETVDRSTEIVLGEEILADREVVDTETDRIVRNAQLTDRQVEQDTDTYPNVSPLVGEVALGAILNYGNTPWTPAANTLRGEVFARDVVVGESDDGSDVGLRAEVVFHPFGEEQRPAYGYDDEGNLVPIFETEPLLDENGERQYKVLENVDGELVDIALNQFVYDENGDRIQETTGTGESSGPGIFIRLEEVLNDDDGTTLSGGLQYTF